MKLKGLLSILISSTIITSSFAYANVSAHPNPSPAVQKILNTLSKQKIVISKDTFARIEQIRHAHRSLITQAKFALDKSSLNETIKKAS